MQFTTTILLAILAASTTLAAPFPASELGASLEARGTPHFPIATRPKPTGKPRRALEDVIELEARDKPSVIVGSTSPRKSGPKPKLWNRPRERDLEGAVQLEARARRTRYTASGSGSYAKGGRSGGRSGGGRSGGRSGGGSHSGGCIGGCAIQK